MRILGIDPGIATIGFGVIDSAEGKQSLVQCGVITTPAHTSLSSRLGQIYDDMTQLIELFKPDKPDLDALFPEFHAGYDLYLPGYGLADGAEELYRAISSFGEKSGGGEEA